MNCRSFHAFIQFKAISALFAKISLSHDALLEREVADLKAKLEQLTQKLEKVVFKVTDTKYCTYLRAAVVSMDGALLYIQYLHSKANREYVQVVSAENNDADLCAEVITRYRTHDLVVRDCILRKRHVVVYYRVDNRTTRHNARQFCMRVSEYSVGYVCLPSMVYA